MKNDMRSGWTFQIYLHDGMDIYAYWFLFVLYLLLYSIFLFLNFFKFFQSTSFFIFYPQTIFQKKKKIFEISFDNRVCSKQFQ